VLGAPGAGELAVLLADQDADVGGQQADQQPGDKQDVDHVQPVDDLVGRELAPEHQEGQPAADPPL
jgi:hypothetical protein